MAKPKGKIGIGTGVLFERDVKPKKTSIGGNDSMIKKSSMNKSKKRSYKPYKGQGR